MENMFTGLAMEKDDDDEARSLKDIVLKEISLVNKPANKRKFLFHKSSSDGGCLDLVATVESLHESFDLGDGEQTAIEKGLRVLTELSSDDQNAMADICLLLGKAFGAVGEVPVSQDDDDDTGGGLWDSITTANQREHHTQKSEANDDALWPSLMVG